MKRFYSKQTKTTRHGHRVFGSFADRFTCSLDSEFQREDTKFLPGSTFSFFPSEDLHSRLPPFAPLAV